MTQKSKPPYMALGVDRLTAHVYKAGNEKLGWTYHFCLHRDGDRSADGSLRFYIDDIQRLMKLTRLVAFELAGDGCMRPAQREQLQRLVHALDAAHAQNSLPDQGENKNEIKNCI